MVFNSYSFLIFFLVVYVLYWAIPAFSGKKRLLLLASYVFYGAWSPPYVLLLLFSTFLDWWLAGRIGRATDRTTRRYLLWLSLFANLGLLGYFKYGGFLISNFADLIGLLGFAWVPPDIGIILPIGISFYTFASLSYTIDVYRGEVRSDWKFSDYALFVSFFPHLVAGPIVRARYLLPQIAAPRLPTANETGWGLAMICMGLFCKVVMADAVFAPVVDMVYAAPEKFGVGDSWAAVLAFSGQIYYDFNGYSMCAVGLALCFGFAFPDNFHHPYAAIGFSDFWRRWHISLSSWLRDYLYVPLGGSRYGAWRMYTSLMLTMLIGGLWHGASWMFVLWGALHGTYLVLERLAKKWLPASPHSRPWVSATTWMWLTFLLVSLTWIPFRAPNTDVLLGVMNGLAGMGGTSLMDVSSMLAVLAMIATVSWHICLRERSLEYVLGARSVAWQLAAISSCLLALFLVSGGDQRAFIYFQF